MDPEPNVMDQKPEEIKQQIDQTRASLTEKLETLENEVLGTVHDVTETVEETIENVKDSVQETVQTVKRTFDLRCQTEQHPWAMLGGSLVAGCLSGMLFGSVRQRRGRRYSAASPPGPRESYRPPSPDGAAFGQQPAREQGGWLGGLTHQFDNEIREVKELAIGTALGLVRDLFKQALPATIGPRVSEIVDSVTSKLGGRTVPSPVVPEHERQTPERYEPVRQGEPAW